MNIVAELRILQNLHDPICVIYYLRVDQLATMIDLMAADVEPLYRHHGEW